MEREEVGKGGEGRKRGERGGRIIFSNQSLKVWRVDGEGGRKER